MVQKPKGLCAMPPLPPVPPSIRDAGPSGPFLSVGAGGIARVLFDDPLRSANVLTASVMLALGEIVRELEAEGREGRIRGVVFLSGKPGTFLVGADVGAIARIRNREEGLEAAKLGQGIFQAIEALPIPTLALVGGSCMGGGTELALACSRVALSDHPKAAMGLPEVLLGILPGWGGSTRLPKRVGLEKALDLLLSGRTLGGPEALRAGLVDWVIPHPLLERVEEPLLTRLLFAPLGPRPAVRPGLRSLLLEKNPLGRRLLFRLARRELLRKTGGYYPAPLRILEALERSHGLPSEAAYRVEAEGLADLLMSPESHHLVRLFQLREGARKESAAERDLHPRAMGVVGAGVMGGGIAQLAAAKGMEVRLQDLSPEALTGGLAEAQKRLRAGGRRKKSTSLQPSQALGRIAASTDLQGFGTLDFVVEAVVENLQVKRGVLQRLEERMPPGGLLASNTSTLSIDQLAEGLQRPERLCGMHFFNPVHRMPLVEIVRGPRSSPEAVGAARGLALRMGKIPVVVGDGPGFVVNRILMPYLNEAGYLVGEGVHPEVVEAAALRFGMPMGPLRLLDEVGIDVALHAGEVLHEALGARMTPAPSLLRLGASGRLGRKGTLGVYRYPERESRGRGRPPRLDPLGIHILLGDREGEGKAAASLSGEALERRLIFPMINEAARVLEEGVAASAGEVDLALIMGTGFPPFRGGLLRYADTLGASQVVDHLAQLAETHGPRFTPSKPLVQLAREGLTFDAHWPHP
jgi:3-hydroxyacyl-CoA dehydrogenase / enoyl-CoA hydratase / 3-hydroxybutyryl-CoA epimerase